MLQHVHTLSLLTPINFQLYVIYLRFKSKFLYKVYNKVQKVNTQQMSNLFTHQTIKYMTDTNYYNKTMYTHTQINNTTEWNQTQYQISSVQIQHRNLHKIVIYT